MPRPGGVPANFTCSPHSLGTERAALSMRRRIAAFALSASARSGGVPGARCHGEEAPREASPCLTSSPPSWRATAARSPAPRRSPALLGQRIEARLHVVGTLPARLQRVDAHHLVLGEADGERLLRVSALEVLLAWWAWARSRRAPWRGPGSRDRRQRRLRHRRLYLGDDLGDIGGQLGPCIFRRLLGDIVLGFVGLPQQALGPPARPAWPPPAANRPCAACRAGPWPCCSRGRSCVAPASAWPPGPWPAPETTLRSQAARQPLPP